jgi:hypothetical protein
MEPLVDRSPGPSRPDGEHLAEGEVALRQVSDAAGHGHDPDLAPLAIEVALALAAGLAPPPEDILGDPGTQLADAEAGVEPGPDAEPLGGRLTGVGEAIGLHGGEWFSAYWQGMAPSNRAHALGSRTPTRHTVRWDGNHPCHWAESSLR